LKLSQRISVLSLEYLRVPTTIGGASAGSLTYEIGFTEYEYRDYEPSMWHEATYADGAARVLVGPGALEFPPGDYMVWLRVTANPEVPVRQAGRVVFFGEEGS
jgi:hypothetical protein